VWDFLEHFDDVRVDRVAQPISEIFTKVTGHSSYFLAALCCWSVAFVSVSMSMYVRDLGSIYLLLTFGYIFNALVAHHYDNRSHSLSLQVISPFRWFKPYGLSRTVTILVFVAIVLFLLYDGVIAKRVQLDAFLMSLLAIGGTGIVAHQHFMACTPVKPPPFKMWQMA
jgi:hypothetical protein